MKISKRKQTLLATRERRKGQDCKVFKLKLDKSHLSKEKKKYLNRLFLEAKWLYNSILSSEDIFKYDTKVKEVFILNKDKQEEIRELKSISSQMKQEIKDNIDIIYNTYGLKRQKLKLIEELSELIKELAKNDGKNIAKELCDVYVVSLGILQNNPNLKEIFDKEVEFKVERQIGRIAKQKIVSKIEELYNKYSEKDWNGYSAAPINEKQKEIVKDFIVKLGDKYLKNLHIMPDPCGEIWLLWTTKNHLKKLTIAISEEGILTYSFRDKNNPKNNIVDKYNLIHENRTKAEFIKQKIENIINKKEKND